VQVLAHAQSGREIVKEYTLLADSQHRPFRLRKEQRKRRDSLENFKSFDWLILASHSSGLSKRPALLAETMASQRE
jgi:hypothetical protein